MPKDNPSFVDQYDWELESRRHEYNMESDQYLEDNERLPAKILVKIKSKKNDNQTNKGALRGTGKKRLQP
jgi:hypothetical protein